MKYGYYAVHIFSDDIDVRSFVSDEEYYEYLEDNRESNESDD